MSNYRYKTGEVVTQEASAKRAQEMYDLWISGRSYRSIGEQYGVSHARVAQIIKQFEDEDIAVYPGMPEGRRREVNEQIRAGIRGLWPKYINGDTPAVHAMVKLLDRYCKLWGIDAPAQIHVNDFSDPNAPWNKIFDSIVVEVNPAEEQRKAVLSEERSRRRSIEG